MVDPLIANINEGENVSINCYASGVPTPVYVWKFLEDGIPADFLGQMTQSGLTNAQGEVIGAQLNIAGATIENTGSYECRVINSHGEEMALAQVNVKQVFDNGSAGDEPL